MRSQVRAFLLAAAFFFPSVAVAQTGGCHTPTYESTQGLSWLTKLVTSTRPSSATLKSNVHITATSASQVTLVSTDSVCTAAAKARALEMQIPYDSAAIYVYKAGDVYVTDEHVGTATAGSMGWRAMHVLDLNYNFLGIIGR